MLSYEYIQFLDEKILSYLPANAVRVGDKINLRCPCCGDSKKSEKKKRGWIYLKNGSYYCFNCGTALSGIKLLEVLSGNDYEDIRKEYTRMFLKSGLDSRLSSVFWIPKDEPSLFELQPMIKAEWKSQLSEKATKYLEGRKVLQAPFYDGHLYSYFSKTNEEYILIPWVLNGCEAYYQLNDFQHLHQMKYIFPKDKKKLIAGLDNIDVSFPYIICFEGFYDSLFVKNGVCLGTKAITDYQEQLIHERFPHHQIVIAFDNDASGIASTISLLKKDAPYKYFKWFDESIKAKDINEYVLQKNDVNMFSNSSILEKMILSKLTMKMALIESGLWNSASCQLSTQLAKHSSNDTSTFWKKRQIQ